MKGWDGVRAWRFIRASEGYRKAWRRHNPPLGLPEPAPFPVRLQTGVDLAALEWGMFAWEDPYAERPTAPFWVRARESAMASSCSWDLGCCGWAQLTLPRPSNLREVASHMTLKLISLSIGSVVTLSRSIVEECGRAI